MPRVEATDCAADVCLGEAGHAFAADLGRSQKLQHGLDTNTPKEPAGVDKPWESSAVDDDVKMSTM